MQKVLRAVCFGIQVPTRNKSTPVNPTDELEQPPNRLDFDRFGQKVRMAEGDSRT